MWTTDALSGTYCRELPTIVGNRCWCLCCSLCGDRLQHVDIFMEHLCCALGTSPRGRPASSMQKLRAHLEQSRRSAPVCVLLLASISAAMAPHSSARRRTTGPNGGVTSSAGCWWVHRLFHTLHLDKHALTRTDSQALIFPTLDLRSTHKSRPHGTPGSQPQPKGGDLIFQ